MVVAMMKILRLSSLMKTMSLFLLLGSLECVDGYIQSTTHRATSFSSNINNKAGGGTGASSLPVLVRTAADQQWEEMHGNYVLRPQPTTTAGSGGVPVQPRALLHFLGGALVGAAPHVSYRYILERLAADGYLIVATPYNLSFDHLETCQSVVDRFQAVLPALQQDYGIVTDNLPVVGIGHSCGSLLHLLMSTSLYNDNRQGSFRPNHVANVLMSFNNKPAKESIPYFDEVVAPLSQSFVQYYKKHPNTLSLVRMAHEVRAASDVGFLLQQMEKAEARAGSDMDFLLYEMKRAATLMRNNKKNSGSRRSNNKNNSKILPWAAPSAVPPSFFSGSARFGLSSLLRPAKRTLQAVTLFNQVFDVLDHQIPNLLSEMGHGASEFFPAPHSVRNFAATSYRAPQTLLVQYADDGIDESEEIANLIATAASSQAGGTGAGECKNQVQRRVLQGGHGAPLLAPPLHVVESAKRSWGTTKAKERLLYAHADATVAELVNYLDHQVGIARLGSTTTASSSSTTTGSSSWSSMTEEESSPGMSANYPSYPQLTT